jgi:hypothetical protein
MARTNNKNVSVKEFTHEGAVAARISPELQLRRSVLACFLWENTFYEDGVEIAKRIDDLCDKVKAPIIAEIALEARHQQHLRHVPLILLRNLLKKDVEGTLIADTIANVISRPDEITEFVSLYWATNKDAKGKRKMFPNQMKKGLARAFKKFNEYSLAKYNQDNAVKLRDVLFMVHAKPDNDEQAALWKKLVNKELTVPDTWEVELSAGKDKKETFERLMREGKLGYFALLRNLRNMVQAGCDLKLVRSQIEACGSGYQHILPFRFIAAARAAPELEPSIDKALIKKIGDLPYLPGRTVVLVDMSESMRVRLSAKSDLQRSDAAAALASIINGEEVVVYSFTDKEMKLPYRKGMAGVDSIINSQNGGTQLIRVINSVNQNEYYDRIIVITDEQAFHNKDSLPNPKGLGYMINVGTYKNGIGYGKWTHIDGFSENVIRFIIEHELSQQSSE